MADILPSSSENVSYLSSSEKFDELNQSMDKLGFQEDIEDVGERSKVVSSSANVTLFSLDTMDK